MHEDETILCPFPERKYGVLRLVALCKVRVRPEKEIYKLAKSLQKEGKLSAKDAIHLACASYSAANFFLTCDDKLIKRSHLIKKSLEIDYPRSKTTAYSANFILT